MSTNFPVGYYDRTHPDDNYEKHLFVAGNVLQSAELNEIQQVGINRATRLGDAIFRDGDVVRDARVSVNATTGLVRCESGAVYLRGAVRGVRPAEFTIPVTETVDVGIYLAERVITLHEDPNLRDPAMETRNYQEVGAARLRMDPAWGYRGQPGRSGEFYRVYTVESGILIPREPPPQLDAVSNAIAAYDRQSTGGHYVVEGLEVTRLEDRDGQQMYSVREGRARVYGQAVSFSASRRVAYDAVADLGRIDSEPFLSTTSAAQRVNLDRSPLSAIQQVRITRETTATITHGNFSGAQDQLPDTAVIEVLEVSQGGTIFVQGTDYRLSAGRIDWSLPGDEPAPGSSYQATYRHIVTVTPQAVDDTGYTVEGAVPGTLIQTTYTWMRPRIDRLCLDRDGGFQWVRGSAADDSPQPPTVPSGLLLLATVEQTWSSRDRTRNDGIRVIPMDQLEGVRANVADLFDLVAQQRLMLDANSREAAAQRGVFVDSFGNNSQRDAGIEQDARLDDFAITLPITTTVAEAPKRPEKRQCLAYTHRVAIGQLSRTGAMKVNPYMAFDPLPAPIKLTPSADHFTHTNTTWASAIWGSRDSTQLLSSSRQSLSLRQIAVGFEITGFGPSESLIAVEFDGIDVTNTVVGG